MPASQFIHLTKDAYGFRVFQEVTPVDRGDSCTIANVTDSEATATIPRGITGGQSDLVLPLPPLGNSAPFVANGNRGMYEYTISIDMDRTTFQARGGSDPKIIIR